MFNNSAFKIQIYNFNTLFNMFRNLAVLRKKQTPGENCCSCKNNEVLKASCVFYEIGMILKKKQETKPT